MRDSWKRPLYADIAIYAAIATISILHYTAPVHAHQLHDIYRRLYYLPIILAAFTGGWRGGLIAAIVVNIAYAPHALGIGNLSHDPATPTQKALEMVLYFAVGTITGALVSRLKRTQRDLRGSLEQLRSTEAQLIQAAKLAAVGRLSAGLAHEIRNPLASIKGSAEIMADDYPPEHPKRRLLEVLVGESDRLNHVLSRFLAFARPRPLEQQEIDVALEIDAVVALLQGQREGRDARITVERGAVAPIRLRADPEQLRQVLLNILLNACQAAGAGGQVTIACERTNGSVRVSVQDSGPGFTPEAIENAFTPFFTTKPQGTGLGLAISHRIIESHGGRIAIANAPGGGGLVQVELPLEG